jgi:hypothetical protein
MIPFLRAMNHLLIGLGGTGIRVIRSFRKSMYLAYRDQSPDGLVLDYMLVDSDPSSFRDGPSNWRTVDENNGGAPTLISAPAEARPTALPAPSRPAVPPTSEKASPAPERAQTPAAQEPAAHIDSHTAVAAPLVPPSSEKASSAPPEPAQPPVAQEPAAQSSRQTAVPPASEKESPVPAPVFGDPGNSGKPRVVATPVAPNNPGPRPAQRPQHVAHTAPHGNMPTPTGNTTSQLNQQELARQKSVASMPDDSISRFFRSLFRWLAIQPIRVKGESEARYWLRNKQAQLGYFPSRAENREVAARRFKSGVIRDG